MASSADTALLEARRQTLLTEISTLVSGGTYNIDGQSVDDATYRASLYKELRDIQEAMRASDGPWEFES